MNTEPTEAHKQKACDLLNEEWGAPKRFGRSDCGNPNVIVAARLIAEQEAPKHPPELVERMVELASVINCYNATIYIYDKARAILAELDASKPDPLDPLRLEADKMTISHVVWQSKDDYEAAKTLTLAALKRGMELERSK